MPSEKTLKRIVIILGVLLVAGFLVIVGTIIYRATDLGEDENSTKESGSITPTLSIASPEGMTLTGFSKNEKVTVFRFRDSEGIEAIMIIDNATGEVLANLKLEDIDVNELVPLEEN